MKAEEEVSRSEERRSSSQSHKKPGCFHPYASNDKSHQTDQKSSIPAWKQIRELSHRNRPRVLNPVNDNYCVKCVTGLKDRVYVPGQRVLNPSPVMDKHRDLTNKSKTVFSPVNSCVANVHSVTGLPQKKGVNPNYCHNYTEIQAF